MKILFSILVCLACLAGHAQIIVSTNTTQTNLSLCTVAWLPGGAINEQYVIKYGPNLSSMTNGVWVGTNTSYTFTNLPAWPSVFFQAYGVSLSPPSNIAERISRIKLAPIVISNTPPPIVVITNIITNTIGNPPMPPKP